MGYLVVGGLLERGVLVQEGSNLLVGHHLLLLHLLHNLVPALGMGKMVMTGGRDRAGNKTKGGAGYEGGDSHGVQYLYMHLCMYSA